MVRGLVKILCCEGINRFILIAVHGIQDNSVLLGLAYVLSPNGNYLGTGIPVCGDSLVLKNAALQLVLETVGIVKLASGKAFGKAEHGAADFRQVFRAKCRGSLGGLARA